VEKTISIADWQQQQPDSSVLLDVRSPGEYTQGHVPGAVSFALFSDAERAAVGTCYKQKGPQQALELGLEFVGPKMAGFVRTARQLAPDRKVTVHCWRGGKRSQSIGWLLRQAGFEVSVLSGGYKQYRRYVLDCFSNVKHKLIVVGGSTGTGKTRILHAMRDAGAQILDLEALAHHKGSAFGFIGEQPQPTVEQFENNLCAALSALDLSQPVWLENESRSIGRVFIPDAFWKYMKEAPLLNVEIPHEARIANLVQDYTVGDKAALQIAFGRIETKLGGLRHKQALEALERNDFATAADIALAYYDKTYQHCLDINVSPDIRHLHFEHGDPVQIAAQLMKIESIKSD
jgi:tRNA 2-selenouridine synthase